MANNCGLNIVKNEFSKKLLKLVNNNMDEYNTLLGVVWKDEDINQAFISWVRKKYGEDIIEKTKKLTVNKIVSWAKAYVNSVRPSVYNDVEKVGLAAVYDKYDYDGIEDREEGKLHSSRIALNYWNNINNNNTVSSKDLKVHVRNEIRSKYRSALRDAINARGSIDSETLNKELEESLADSEGFIRLAKEAAFYELKLDGEKTDRERSLLAVFRELATKEGSEQYIEDILNKKELQDLKKQIDKQEGKDVETQDEETNRKDADAHANQNDVENGEDSSTASSDDVDTTITAYNSHMGQYTTYMTHIGARLRNYFNTLPVLRSKVTSVKKDSDGNKQTVYDIDRNNRYGFENYMNADACASMLYSEAWQFTDVPTMISVIRELGTTVPTYTSFIKMADDLEKDYDFAYEMFTVFSKTIVSKLQVISKSDNNTILRISNERAHRREAFRQSCSNALRSACISVDDNVFRSRLNKLQEKIDKLDRIIENSKDKSSQVSIDELEERCKNTLNDVIPALKKLTKQYFNNLEEEAISTYIEVGDSANGNVFKQAVNCKALSNMLYNINEYSSIARENFESNAKARSEAYNKRAEQINAISNGYYVNPQDIENDLSVYNKEIITGDLSEELDSAIDKFEPYSTPNIQLNHPNVKGNNASDVINNSYITNLIKMFDLAATNKEEYVRKLVNWGQERLNNQRSIMYNTVLYDQYDENNNKISDGIFSFIDEKTRTQIKLNDNTLKDGFGHKQIEIALFDGAMDNTNGNSMTYNQMVEGDYFPTIYNAFISKRNNQADNRAYYFPRTPSDAPTIFAILAPKFGHGCFGDNAAGRSEIAKSIATDFLTQAQDISFASPVPGIPMGDNEFIDITPKEYEDNDGQYRFLDGLLGEDIFITKQYREYFFEKEGTILDQYKVDGKVVTEYLNDQESVPYLRYKAKLNGKDYRIFVSGTIEERNGSKVLTNPHITNIIPFTTLKQLRENKLHKTEEGQAVITQDGIEFVNWLATKLGNRAAGWVLTRQHTATIFGKEYTEAERVVDTSSNDFKLLKNQFKQELLDMAVALDLYFETKTDKERSGMIEWDDKDKKNREPKLRDKSLNEKGYAKYHLGKDGKVLTKQGNKFVLGGRVFHSEKFTLSLQKVDKNGNVEEYKENFLDKLITTDKAEKSDGMIELFYGGQSGNFLHTVRDAEGNIIDVTLTPEQNAKVDEQLSKFIIEYQKQIDNKVREYNDFIKQGKNTTLDNRTSFGFNYFLMECNYDGLFEGNSKFYKDSQDLLKRAKEKQGSGVPYANVNYLSDNEYDLSIIEECYLNRGTYNGKLIKKILSEHLGHDVNQRWAFQGVTVHNSKMTNDEALTQLTEQLTKVLVNNNGFDKDDARAQALNILYGPEEYDEDTKQYIRRGGFQEQKVNDAQSYITVDEWIRRIAARGQLTRYMPLIIKLVDPNAQLTSEDINEFVQVQKNFYFDIIYDARYKTYVPRQIKNAEFVLVPKLIKGTELEQVYNMMIEADIDQLNTLETSKAANEEVITLWDNNGKFTGANTFVEQAQRLKQVYSYKYLYTQQETPQHMNSKNKAGIQIVKKILDNIGEDSDVYDDKIAFFDNMIQNIRESFQDLMLKFDIPLDSNGNIITDEYGQIKNLNKAEFYSRLKEELLRLGVDSNLIDYVTLDENGEPLMPPLFNMVLSRFEQVVQSMFNQAITRQKLPGFHAAQVTNIGWNSFKFYKKNIVTKENAKDETLASYAKNLEYHPMTYKKGNTIISNREYQALENKEGWVENGPARYIEVMLSAEALGIDRNDPAYRGKSDEAILKMLQDAGLDEVIGYRIPTEGKQSMAVMKVVGLLSKAYGSTIVVANDWVSQTGSDFDIDSIYGIQFNVRKDKKTGEISKVKYLQSQEYGDGVSLMDWYRYIKQFRKRVEINKNTSKETLAKINAIDDAINSAFNSFEEEHKIFESLPETDKEYFKSGDAITKESSFYNDARSGAERYRIILEFRIEDAQNYLEQYKDEFSDEDKKKIEDFIEANERILELYENSEDDTNYLPEKILQANRAKIEEAIKGTQLLDYEGFVHAAYHNPERINSRSARENKILDSFMNILKSDDALEENLSRSNFDDITYWKNKLMNPNLKAARKNRSAYNVLDQIAYQEDAMVGYKLKGVSVMMDTGCSIFNTAKPKLDSPVTIVYDDVDYNADVIEKAFGSKYEDETLRDGTLRTDFSKKNKNAVYDKKKHTITVVHDTYGHSMNNRNVVGRILTAYSSQTTAHILDAIKEGAVPGVNTYTFGAYKTLLNIGSDFKCAIGFIMQPGIERIVRNYNANRSVYSNRYSNPITQSIKDIAEELLDKKFDKRTTMKQVFKELEQFTDEFNEILGNTSKKDEDKYKISLNIDANRRLPIIVSKLVDRLQNTGEFDTKQPVEGMSIKDVKRRQLLFDLAIVMSFNHLNFVSGQVMSMLQVLNPDKFGAKKSVYETSKTFDDIAQQIYNFENVQNPKGRTIQEKFKPKQTTLSLNGTHILQAIYPGIEEGTESDLAAGIINNNRVYRSAYQPLYAYLKYSTGTSLLIARKLFDTQHPEFVRAISGFRKVMSGINPTMDEKLYSSLEKYALTYLYNKIPQISHPVIYDYKKKEIVGYDENVSALDERRRILGWGYPNGVLVGEFNTVTDEDGSTYEAMTTKPFTVFDVNDPTEAEVKEYMKLTPAQKVEFIKTNFAVKGLFGKLDVSLYNIGSRGARYQGVQTIEFTENTIDKDVMLDDFTRLFNSKNPLIKLAMVDIIKYAVMFEGMNMRSRGITKIISNKPLIEALGNSGIGFVDAIRDKLQNLDKGANITQENVQRELYENYLRSHDVQGVRTLYWNNRRSVEYGLVRGPERTFIGKPDIVSEEDYENTEEYVNKLEEELDTWQSKLVDSGIMSENEYTEERYYNEYVYVSENGIKKLYKITPMLNGSVILYPLGKLEENEVSQISSNPTNRKEVPYKQYYEELLNGLNNRYAVEPESELELDDEVIEKFEKHIDKTGHPEQYRDIMQPVDASVMPASNFNINTIANDPSHPDSGGMREAINDIVAEFAPNGVWLNAPNRIYIQNKALSKYIFSADPKYGSKQEIPYNDEQEKHKVTITKVNTPRKIKPLLKKAGKRYEVPDSIFENELSRALYLKNYNSNLNNKHLAQIVRNVRGYGGNRIDDLLVVESNVETMASPTEEANVDLFDYMSVDKTRGNSTAVKEVSALRRKGIESDNVGFEENTAVVTKHLATYVNAKIDELITHGVNQFIKDPNQPDTYIKMNDPRIIEMMTGDQRLVNKYIKTLNELQALLDRTAPYFSLNVKSSDPELNFYLTDIKNAHSKLLEVPIHELRLALAEGYIAKLSTDNLIKDDIIKVYDGFFQTTGWAWAFNDIMENGNPILQITLKEVMGSMDAARIAGERLLANHHKKLAEIEAWAREHGQRLDKNRVFLNNGRLAQNFIEQFTIDMDNLYANMTDAAKEHGYGSYEHLMAKLEYDEFINKYCHQEAKASHYKRINKLVRKMLTDHKDIYVAYMTQWYKAMELRNYSSEVGLNADMQKKLTEIEFKMRGITDPNYYYDEDGEAHTKKEYDNLEELTPDERIYSKNEATSLNKFLQLQQKENGKTYTYDSVYGFNEQLQAYLRIVESYEQVDPETGIQRIPQDRLEEIEEYRVAKNWIRENAYFELVQTEASENNPDSLGNKLKNALSKLALASNGRRVKLKKFLKENAIYDSLGIPDPRGLTQEQLAQLKKEQENYYYGNNSAIPRGSDKLLINSKNKTENIYKQAFWDNLHYNLNEANADYVRIVTELNKELAPLYDDEYGGIHFEWIPDTEEGIAKLKRIANLYKELDQKTTGNREIEQLDETELEEIKRFREEESVSDTNWDIYNQQYQIASQRSEKYFRAWRFANCALDKNGILKRDDNNKLIPKRSIYTRIIPKNEQAWIDKERMQNMALINKYYKKTYTKYYYAAIRQAKNKFKNDEAGYKKWYEDNHVYNPYTRKYEPIEIYTKQELRYDLFDENEYEGKWVPRNKQRERKVQDGHTEYIDPLGNIESFNDPDKDMTNHKYKEGFGHEGNYIVGADNGKYDSKLELTEAEMMLRDYIQEMLINSTDDERAKRFFERGYLPKKALVEHSKKKTAADALLQQFGISPNLNKSNKYWNADISYAAARQRSVPMIDMLRSKDKGTTDFKEPMPQRKDFPTPEEYRKAYEDWKTRRQEVIDKNKEVEQAILDRDWMKVLDEFIIRNNKHNSIQQNVEKLYYLHNMIKNQKVFDVNYGLRGTPGLNVDKRRSNENSTVYTTSYDQNLLKQLETLIHRVVFDEWKEANSARTRVMNHLQNFTSANYMMLNFRGGISNVTLGETSMWAEAAAGEYFEGRDLLFGHLEWNKGIIGFCRGLYSEEAANLQDAITKKFKVVDYDEQRGTPDQDVEALEKYTKRVRNAMFSPQTIGEHYMQNSVLFAMLRSHKLVEIPDDVRGIGVTFMNKAEYIRYRQADLLSSILNDEQKQQFEKFKNEIKSNTEEKAQYAWRRRDVATEFAYIHLNDRETSERYLKLKRESRKQIEAEFEKKDNLYNQLDFADGKLVFKQGSKLEKLDTYLVGKENLTEEELKELRWQENNYNITKADMLCGLFSERVRKVNNKIHGVYNRVGRAYIENKWWGSLVMQYHKHLPIGLLKRYRTRGVYNETRGTTEKGIFSTINDFLSLNARKVKHEYALKDSEVEAIEGAQNLIKYALDQAVQLRETWKYLPEYDKANIRRQVGDLIGVLAGVLTVVALLGGGDDDDVLKKSRAWNLALYEADRLASEAFLYNPIGLWTETKTLMSTPVAGMSIVNDIFSACRIIGGYVVYGSDYDATYQSGKFAGRNKLGVFLERRTPMWNGIRGVWDAPINNRAYKIGAKPTSVASTILSWIRE